jgi:hypothetical protein
MGILDDTLLDAARPLPQLTLRRAIDDAAPEFDPEPAEESTAALTVFRLQKDGGVDPPVAPPAPRAVDAGKASARPLHAPVGFFDDATLQFVTSIEGLETGKGQASTWNSDATDRQERLVSSEPSHRLDYGVSTGSSVFSNRVPSPFDDPGNLVHRIESSDGMRRATGRGAPSGETAPARIAADPAVMAQELPTAARRGPQPNADERTAGAAAALPGGAMPPLAGADVEPMGEVVTVPAARRPTAEARPAAQIPQPALRSDTNPVRMSQSAAAPRLSIGRIEVTVLSAPQAAAKPAAAPTDAFLSKHYLRRL